MKVVRLSALRTSRLDSLRNIPGTHFCYRLSQPQSHSASGRIISKENSSDTIGNRTGDLPACSAVPQPTALPRAPTYKNMHSTNKIQIIMNTFSIHSIIPQKNCLLNISNFHLPDIRLYIPFITIKFTITANKYHETVSLQFS